MDYDSNEDELMTVEEEAEEEERQLSQEGYEEEMAWE